MKRLVLMSLILAVSLAVAGSFTETFTYSRAQLTLGARDGYTTVDFVGAAHYDDLGMPDLPGIPCYVSIPPTAIVTGIEILDIEEEDVAGTCDLLPVQHPVPYMLNPPKQEFVEADPAVYSTDAAYPGSAIQASPTRNKAGYRVAGFTVRPVRYNPVTQKLSVVTSLRVRVNYATGKLHATRRTEAQNAIHGDHVRTMVLNPRDVRRFAPPKRTRSYGSAFLPPGDFEHVIITTAPWTDSLQRLVDWRTRQGWRSRFMLEESICATYPGRDSAEQIRNFVKDADTTWGTIFVFMARNDYPGHGDVRTTHPYSSYHPKSDMYYSDLDGDWDANANNTFGELADNIDGMADLFVGMITITDGAELSNYLDKVFRYEFTPDTNAPWTTKSLLANGVTFANEFQDSIANATPTPPWFDLKMYTSGGMITPSPAKYTDSLNSGYGITSVIAHGSPDLYSLGGNVTSPMMNGLTNTDRLNFFTAVCCNTGEWDRGSTNGDCIAENMAFHAPNGFVGVCKNDKSGWIDVAELYNYSICFGLLGHNTARRVTQAEALAWGKDFWNGSIGQGKWLMEAQERNLFGAPAVPLWTDAVYVADVTKPGAINIGTGIPVTITVNNPTTAPVESALVCLVKGTETFGRGWTDASGQITLMMSPLTPGQMQVTVTCANNIPYLDSIPVMAAGRFVAFLRSTIDDSIGGNDDGIINPGETVKLPSWVKNYGSQTASGVTGKLITHTAGITVTDEDATFGDIPGEDSAYDADAWEIQVAAGLPNGYAIPCSVVCRDTPDSVWVSYVTYYVGAPALSYVEFAVIDGLDPTGVLDPGETADLEITIRNSGMGHATGVTSTIRSTDARLTFGDSTAAYGTVMAGSLKVNTGDHFTATADASIPKETVIECTLDLYGDGGYESHHAFSIEIGEVRSVDPIPDNTTPVLYWAYDDGDSDYVQAPTFEWFDISGLGTRLTLSDDQTVQVNLPTGFGPFVYYGRSFTQVSICGNGWVGPGHTTSRDYTNHEIPNTSDPTMLAMVWDDLYPPNSNGVYWYHDAANHRFIVQYDSMPYYSNRNVFDWHQVIIYDTTMAAEDGNSVFTYQYLTANSYGSMTAGISDSTTGKGIQALFDGSYHRGSLPIEPGRAIFFSTDEPTTGVYEPTKPTALTRRALIVAPNPFARSAIIHWNLARESDVELKVFDATGRAVRTLASGTARAGAHTTLWNGTDNSGRKLAHGIYFVRLATPDRTVKVKTILTR